MSMVCFDLSAQLHAKEQALRSIQVTDGESLCAYLKGFWEFIYNHKMFGSVYEIYADNVEVHRENGFVLRDIPAVEHEVMRLCSAFPDLKVVIPAIFAAPELQKEKALNISSFHVEKMDGEWLITFETTGLCCDYIRAVCTGDQSFTTLEL